MYRDLATIFSSCAVSAWKVCSSSVAASTFSLAGGGDGTLSFVPESALVVDRKRRSTWERIDIAVVDCIAT